MLNCCHRCRLRGPRTVTDLLEYRHILYTRYCHDMRLKKLYQGHDLQSPDIEVLTTIRDVSFEQSVRAPWS